MVKDTVTNSLPRSLLGFVGNVSGHGITQSLYTFLVKTGGITRQTSLYKCRLTIVNSEEVVSPGQKEELKGKKSDKRKWCSCKRTLVHFKRIRKLEHKY